METYAIIAAYNEENHVTELIHKIKEFIPLDKIILVDDGSQDNTYALAKKTGAKIMRHIINLGKGAAIKTGCDYALLLGAKQMILIDADLQHDPEEIPHFLKELQKEKAIVLGYRKFNKNMPFIFKLGNSIINRITKILYNIQLKDTQCGYRAFTAETYTKIRWRASDYSMESEIIANVGKHHLPYKEIPIATIYTNKYKGTTIFDGIKIVLNMLFWRITR